LCIWAGLDGHEEELDYISQSHTPWWVIVVASQWTQSFLDLSQNWGGTSWIVEVHFICLTWSLTAHISSCKFRRRLVVLENWGSQNFVLQYKSSTLRYASRNSEFSIFFERNRPRNEREWNHLRGRLEMRSKCGCAN
jgi:hypothetical protein